jgi:hypothetical protein
MVNTYPTTIISKTADQPTDRPIWKIGAVLPNPQLSLSSTAARRKTAAMHKDVSGRVPEPFVHHAQPINEPTTLISMIQPPRENNDKMREEQGPWSREAFDLFDWRPEAKSTRDSSAAS